MATLAWRRLFPVIEESSDLGQDAATLQQDISGAGSQISTLEEDVSILAEQGAEPPAGTQAAITAAHNAISQAVAAGNKLIDQGNQVSAQAV